MFTAKKGDKINAMGIAVTIGDTIYYSDSYSDHNGKRQYDIEFKDSNGQYRHWKSEFDGGEYIPC